MQKVATNNGPRTWSSYTNITTKDDRTNFKMNSVDNILEYRNLSSIYYSPPLFRKTAATTYDFPEQPTTKKDKKWSLGSLFRRKKKDESESSSEEEVDRKGFLNRRKKKSDKKKKTKQRTTFDHIIVPPTGASVFNGHSTHDENGILSDPTGGFGSYTGRVITRTPNQIRKSQQVQNPKELASNVNASRSSLGSADSLYKSTKKIQVKIRAEARRETNICASSSDEDSQRSASSSRLRSDESINKPFDASTNRKSRTARTERYMKRMSKEEELVPALRTSKSDAENNIKLLIFSEEKKEMNRTASRSPMLQNNPKLRVVSQNSGLSTVPPSHMNLKRNNLENVHTKIQKPPINNVNRFISLNNGDSKDSYLNYQRSVSYDADIHRSASPDVSTEVIHAQLPLGKPSHRFRNLSLVEQPKNVYFKQPPPPPPRDPWRVVTVQHADHGRPMSYCFERTQRNYQDFANSKSNVKPHSFNWRSNIRSTSEDHLPLESSPVPFHPRPSSATSDHPNQTNFKRNQEHPIDQYQYLADKNPRSRKPIFIQSFKDDDKNESPKPLDFWINKDLPEKSENKPQSEAQKALDFWKQKEEEGRQMEKKSSLSSSPQIFTASTHVRTNIFLPSVLKSDAETAEEYRRSSPFKPISPQVMAVDESHNRAEIAKVNDTKTEPVKQSIKDSKSPSPTTRERKSSNLEDALDELEAIYNSLRLGDEDLLERAEERERSIAAKKMMEMNSEVYPGWGVNTPRGAISDSSFNYEPFDSVDSPKRKRLLRKIRNSDRKNDDMAIRKLNKERSSTISDPKEVISKVSYLLASPLHGLSDDVSNNPSKSHKEPDVTYDDMVFRTVKHANNTLKVSDPQPPFGIPVGPILPASNSDYLHAMPDETPKYTIRNKKIPDIVKDDLAYRNLRKDNCKDPVLPPLMSDDIANNNNPIAEPFKPAYSSIKKKRAVRSLSANIYNLIQNEPFVFPISEEKSPERLKEKTSLNDIADAMEIARQILREKEEKINATRRAFLSDTEAKYKKLETSNSYLTECRMNFLNNMKSKENEREHKNDTTHFENYLTGKPPRGMTPDKKVKESSLSPSDVNKIISFDKNRDQSVLPNKILQVNVRQEPETEVIKDARIEKKTEELPSSNESSNTSQQRSSLEDLLTAFAVEAQEASRRIADELKELERNIHANRDKSDDSPSDSIAVEEIKCLDATSSGEALNKLSDAEIIAITEIQPEIAEETKGLTPHVVSLANIVQTTCDVMPVDDKPIITEIHSDSDHDYVNMGSDAEIEKAIPLIDESANDSPSCKSPYEEKKADLIAGFQELKKVASDPDLLETKAYDSPENCAGENGGNRGGEDCVLTCDTALTSAENTECAFLTRTFINVSETGSIVSYVSGCKIDLKDNGGGLQSFENDEGPFEVKLFLDESLNSIGECDVSNQSCNRLSLNESPHSSGFHSNSVSDAEQNEDDGNECFRPPTLLNENPLSSLKSPKLVLNSTLNLENRQLASSLKDSDVPAESSCSTSSSIDVKNKFKMDGGCSTSKNLDSNRSRSTDRRHTFGENPDPSFSWCIDPLVLAFACSYGVACTYQFVSMDIVTILGLLFVFVSFIAALIL